MFGIDDIFSGIFNKETTKENQHNQFVYDIQRMNYQQGLQKSMQEWMWNKQYGAQVSGMKNAGLNPGGNAGGIAAQTAPAVPIANGGTPSTPGMSMNFGGIIDIVNAIQKGKELDIGQQNANSTKTAADAKANLDNAEAERIRSEIPGSQAESDMKQKRNNVYQNLLDNEIEKGLQENRLLSEQSDTEVAKRAAIKQDIEESQQRIKNMQEEAKRIGAEAAYLKMKTIFERGVLQAQRTELLALAKKHGADAAAAADHAWAAVQDALTRSVVGKSEAERNAAEKELAMIQKDLADKYGDAEKIAHIFGEVIGTAASSFLGVGVGAKALGFAGKGAARIVGFGN